MKSFFSYNILTHEEIKKRLGKSLAEKFENSIHDRELDPILADKIACVIKKWAIKKGAKFYAHLFFPYIGKPALKYTSLMGLDGECEFNGQILVRGEADASSFPSGGNRSTAKARGYVIWDRISPVFIDETEIGKVLYLPSFFISHTGEALDEKKALFKAASELDKHLTHILNMFGVVCKHTFFTLGFEQEYFLIEKEKAFARPDLMRCGRTLFGTINWANQEFYSHYFSAPNAKVQFFMKRLHDELLPLGVVAKVQHGEVAPCQFEVVPIFKRVELSYLVGAIVRAKIDKLAEECGLVAIFHEKPFRGLNGSGKHNNWSLSTDTNLNLLDPHKIDSNIFMFLISCILSAVNKHYDLIRMSVCDYSNDPRLGGNEAPPSLISVYVGEEVQQMIDNVLGKKGSIGNGCDRNRTSPFAFTGNKFEFRMLGANQSLANCNMIIIAAITDELKRAEKVFVDRGYSLQTLKSIVHRNLLMSSSIVYNGDNYSDEWIKEAERRKLKVYDGFIDTLDLLTKKENIRFLNSGGIMSREEIKIFDNVRKEKYINSLLFEAHTINSLINTQIIPKLQNEIEKRANKGTKCEISPCNFKNITKNSPETISELGGYVKQLENKQSELKNADENTKWPIIEEQKTIIGQIIAFFDGVWPLLPKGLLPFISIEDMLL